MGVVLLREFLDDRVRTANHIENLIGMATIGTITRQNGDSLLLSVLILLRRGDLLMLLCLQRMLTA